MNNHNPYLLLFIIIICLAACVSPHKYDALLQENEFLKEENNVLREELTFSSDDYLLESKLEADVDKLKTELQQAKQRYATLEQSYLSLTTQNPNSLGMNNKGNSFANKDEACQSQLNAIKRTLDQQNRDMRIIQISLQQKEMQIKDLERLLHNQSFNR